MPISDDRFTPAELAARTLVRKAIGEAIRRRREHLGLTQVAVAAQASISARELRRIEQGRGGMQLDRLWPIAQALNCDPSEIVAQAEAIERASGNATGLNST